MMMMMMMMMIMMRVGRGGGCWGRGCGAGIMMTDRQDKHSQYNGQMLRKSLTRLLDQLQSQLEISRFV